MNVSLGDNYTLSHSELHVRPSQLDDKNKKQQHGNEKGHWSVGSSDQASTREFDQWVDWSGTSPVKGRIWPVLFFSLRIFRLVCVCVCVPYIWVEIREKRMDKSLEDERGMKQFPRSVTGPAFFSFILSLPPKNIFTSCYYYRSFLPSHRIVVCRHLLKMAL